MAKTYTDNPGGYGVNDTQVIDENGNLMSGIVSGLVDSDAMDAALLKSVTVTLTPTTIVGTAAGDIASTGGAVAVAAEAGKIHLFDSAVFSYNFDTAAYTGGGDDLVIRQGTTAMTAPIAKADLLLDTEDDIAFVSALSAADIKLTANSTLNIFAGTAYTQPGTAAGTCKVTIFYRTVEA